MRRDAGDVVSGQLQLGFAWDVTARSLLSLKLAALENVLAQRQEILCALSPVPAATVLRWIKEPPPAPKVSCAAHACSCLAEFLGAQLSRAARHGICFLETI